MLVAAPMASCRSRRPGKLTGLGPGGSACVALAFFPSRQLCADSAVLNLSSLVAETDGGRLSGAQPVLGVFQSQTC